MFDIVVDVNHELTFVYLSSLLHHLGMQLLSPLLRCLLQLLGEGSVAPWIPYVHYVLVSDTPAR